MHTCSSTDGVIDEEDGCGAGAAAGTEPPHILASGEYFNIDMIRLFF